MISALVVSAALAAAPIDQQLAASDALERCLDRAISDLDDGRSDAAAVSSAAQARCQRPYIVFLARTGVAPESAAKIARDFRTGKAFLSQVLEHRRITNLQR